MGAQWHLELWADSHLQVHTSSKWLGYVSPLLPGDTLLMSLSDCRDLHSEELSKCSFQIFFIMLLRNSLTRDVRDTPFEWIGYPGGVKCLKMCDSAHSGTCFWKSAMTFSLGLDPELLWGPSWCPLCRKYVPVEGGRWGSNNAPHTWPTLFKQPHAAPCPRQCFGLLLVPSHTLLLLFLLYYFIFIFACLPT